MAEGYARELGRGILEPYSAGLFPSGVNPYAIRIMKEDGIDISNQTSDPIDEGLLEEMDVVITLCGNAEASCPTTPPNIRRIHWPIDDPFTFSGNDEERLAEFRRVRDEIKERIQSFLGEIRAMERTP